MNGKTLTTLTGNFVNVTVKAGSAGPIVYINEAPITGANIKAGNSMIHEMGGIVVTADYQDLVNSMSTPLAAPSSSADLSQAGTTTTTPVPTSSGDTSSTSTQSTEPATTAESGTTGSISTPTTSTTKSSAGITAMGAAVLAVPALLAVLL
eukprot:GHUV01041114.1.p1 GENE.GHUV01041114.1~~GHUV01041114.1.p1  ORF type:complete len:151 (+),score=35.61 GHUV01041114.1:639-1091(+)